MGQGEYLVKLTTYVTPEEYDELQEHGIEDGDDLANRFIEWMKNDKTLKKRNKCLRVQNERFEAQSNEKVQEVQEYANCVQQDNTRLEVQVKKLTTEKSELQAKMKELGEKARCTEKASQWAGRWSDLQKSINATIQAEIPADQQIISMELVCRSLFEHVQTREPVSPTAARPRYSFSGEMNSKDYGKGAKAIESLFGRLKPRNPEKTRLYEELSDYFIKAFDLWKEMKDEGYVVQLNCKPCRVCNCGWRVQPMPAQEKLKDPKVICLFPKIRIQKDAMMTVVDGLYALQERRQGSSKA
ncbi:uncharacterized protein Z518_04879 [Rhinocladiella mackenziei CBS 650.93]|uniref:Uncharacterized protein n=1 Tax=Rhinocladiella mackenziei CBS 650.93 TaxID=1442369 RepID=A0A0D2H8V7_9EURO|nr:uncharacterized protein Z518_04879 [Rhinocladiella mackenziei CBS 650.93]KIX06903.1 hypothetical protein Z518_04879 [Rhinocladiella mackenziei CBS 650.93]